VTGRRTPRALRWCAGAVAAAGAVAWLRVQLGPWPAALVIAPALWLSVIGAWWRAEAGAERRAELAAPPVHHRPAPGDVERTTATHVQFARGLHEVSAWYLDACERDAGSAR
jgi:hypothetical protein